MNNVMQVMQMVSPHLPKHLQAGSGSKHGNELSGETNTFAHLLGGFVTEGNTALQVAEVTEKVSSESVLQLLQQLMENGGMTDERILSDALFLSEELLTEQGVSDLLALLPEEWQKVLTELMSNEELPSFTEWESWPEEQQGLLLLLTFLQQEKNQQAHALQARETQTQVSGLTELNKLLGQTFPFLLNEKNQGSPKRMLEQLVQHIKEKLASTEGRPINAQQFASLLGENQEKRTSPLLTMVKTPFNEPVKHNGLNLSQTGQELGQAMTRAQQATIHLGEQLPRDVQQQQFLKQFQQILQRSTFTQNQAGMNTLSIKLHPAHLGRLDIQFTQIEGSIVARILTGSGTARELMESQLTQLRQAFIQQNLNVERIEITQQPQQQLSQQKEDESAGKEQSRDYEQAQQEEEFNDSESETFQEMLEDITFNEQV